MALTFPQARLRLARMVAAETDPILTIDDLDELLLAYRRRDSSGRAVTDALWTPTFDLAAAAVEGWRWKAAKASDLSSVRTGDLTFEDGMIFEHCQKMVEHYQRLVNRSVSFPLETTVEVLEG